MHWVCSWQAAVVFWTEEYSDFRPQVWECVIALNNVVHLRHDSLKIRRDFLFELLLFSFQARGFQLTMCVRVCVRVRMCDV